MVVVNVVFIVVVVVVIVVVIVVETVVEDEDLTETVIVGFGGWNVGLYFEVSEFTENI